MSERSYYPTCADCCRAAGNDASDATWQCHRRALDERDQLRAEVRRLREQSSRWEAAYLSECRCRAKDFDEFCRLRQERDAALAERDAERQTRAMCDRTIEGFRAEVVSLGERLNITIAERDALRADLCEGECGAPRSRFCTSCSHGDTEAALAEARRMLRGLEWAGGTIHVRCLDCGYTKTDGHARTCALAAVLAQEKLS